MEHSQGPAVDVSFAPTNAFAEAYPEETVNEHARKFAAASWAATVTPQQPAQRPKEKEEEEGETMLYEPQQQQRRRVCPCSGEMMLAIGGTALAGATIAVLILRALGYLRTA